MARGSFLPAANTFLEDPTLGPAMVRGVPSISPVTAGLPVLAEEQALYPFHAPVPRLAFEQLMALQVTSDSLVGASIQDEDVLGVSGQPAAANNDIVPPLLCSESTVKWWIRSEGNVSL